MCRLYADIFKGGDGPPPPPGILARLASQGQLQSSIVRPSRRKRRKARWLLRRLAPHGRLFCRRLWPPRRSRDTPLPSVRRTPSCSSTAGFRCKVASLPRHRPSQNFSVSHTRSHPSTTCDGHLPRNTKSPLTLRSSRPRRCHLPAGSTSPFTQVSSGPMRQST